jgi:hypothetical protein
MKTYWGSGGIAPRSLDLGSRWRWVVSFKPRPLYPQGKKPRYPLGGRLGGPQSRSGRSGEEKKSHNCPCRESNPGHPGRRVGFILTEEVEEGKIRRLEILPNVVQRVMPANHRMQATKTSAWANTTEWRSALSVWIRPLSSLTEWKKRSTYIAYRPKVTEKVHKTEDYLIRCLLRKRRSV